MKILQSIKGFLGASESQEKTIAKNTIWLFFAEGISYLLKFVWVVYVIRVLGATDYGRFSFALGFVSLFIIFSDLGLSMIITRELSKDKEEEKNFSALLTLKIIISFVTFLIIIGSAFLISNDWFIRQIMFILGFFVIIDSFPEIFYSFFRAQQKMYYEFLGKILRSLILAGIGFAIIFYAPSIKNIALAYLLSGVTSLLIIWLLFHHIFHKIRLSYDLKIWKKFLMLAWPLAISGIFSTIYSQMDSSIMGFLGQMTQTGWYNAVYRIIGALLVPVTLLSIGFFPALNVALKESREKFQKAYEKFMKTMVFISIPMMIGGLVLAPRIIDWIYNQSYLPATFSFKMLLIMVTISYLVTPLTIAFTVLNQQKKIFWFSIVSALINLFLNLWLIPKYSLNAAAITTLISVSVIFILCIFAAYKNKLFALINKEILKTVMTCILASGAMLLVLRISFIYKLHVLIAVLIGSIVYFSAVILLMEFSKIIKPLIKKPN